MAKEITVKELQDALEPVKHPAINCSLIELGIVRDMVVVDGKAVITLAFPFPNIPIAAQLINSVREPLEARDIAVEINTTVMTQEQVQHFLTKEKENWQGLA